MFLYVSKCKSEHDMAKTPSCGCFPESKVSMYRIMIILCVQIHNKGYKEPTRTMKTIFKGIYLILSVIHNFIYLV